MESQQLKAPIAPSSVDKKRSSNMFIWRRKILLHAFRNCERCNSAHGLTIDHVTPLALGGDNNICNLQVLCGYCNLWKGGLSALDFRREEWTLRVFVSTITASPNPRCKIFVIGEIFGLGNGVTHVYMPIDQRKVGACRRWD